MRVAKTRRLCGRRREDAFTWPRERVAASLPIETNRRVIRHPVMEQDARIRKSHYGCVGCFRFESRDELSTEVAGTQSTRRNRLIVRSAIVLSQSCCPVVNAGDRAGGDRSL